MPSGELDLASAPALAAEVERAWRSGAELVTVDLRGVEFMDSTGLRVIIRAHENARDAGRQFGIIDGGDQVHKLLSLTRVLDRLHVTAPPAN
jgi:anti-anti-sigma factor